jgi:ribosomal protein L40E
VRTGEQSPPYRRRGESLIFVDEDGVQKKVCTKCGEAKPLAEFHKSKRRSFGLTSKCRQCAKEYDKARYDRLYRKPHIEQEPKTTKICTKCGEDKPLEAFYTVAKGSSKRMAACKICLVTQQKEANAKKRAAEGRGPRPSWEERFWSKIDKSGECWIWTAQHPSGYPKFIYEGKVVAAHRFMYELVHGGIPENANVLHSCGNSLCVRPEHLLCRYDDGYEPGMQFHTPWRERFWSYVDKSGDCWEWTGCDNGHGYGVFGVANDSKAAHRVSYEMEHGPIPEGMEVCHHCDNPCCVRPSHLFLGTQADNMRDMYSKGRQSSSEVRSEGARRQPRGEEHHFATLSNEEARQIWQLHLTGMRKVDMAQRLNVKVNAVYRVTNSDCWAHVKE